MLCGAVYFKGGLSPTFGFALHRALQGGADDKIFILQVTITGLRGLGDLREVIQLARGGANFAPTPPPAPADSCEARKTRDTWTTCPPNDVFRGNSKTPTSPRKHEVLVLAGGP